MYLLIFQTQLLPENPEHFQIVDYGCSDGKNSMVWVNKVVDHIKEVTNNSPPQIQLVFVDLEANDWNYFWKETISPYLTSEKNLIISSVGRSFFNQVQPNNTVSIGLSATAFHWTSSIPSHIKSGSVLCHLSEDQSELAPWKEQARNDWNQLLRHRANELKKGGKLIVTGLCWKDDGWAFKYVFSLMNESLHSLVKEGLVSEDVLSQVTYPVYIRTEDEYLSFDESIPLNVTKVETYSEASPIYIQFQENGDLNLYAEKFTLFIKSAYDPVLRSALRCGMEEGSLNQLMAKFWNTYREKIKLLPESVAVGQFIVAVFEKK